MDEVFDRIHQLESHFSARQKLISEYILEHYKQAAFMNSTELANAIGVSNPTVIRFTTALGYSGFPQFQAELQAMVQNDLSSLERLDRLRLSDEEDACSELFRLEVDNMVHIYHQIDKAAMEAASRLLFSSEAVFIVGRQISAPMAQFAEYSLGKIRKEVYLVNEWSMSHEKALRGREEKCCALVFLLPRYPNHTLQLIQFFQKQGIPMIIITDSASSCPAASLAEILLTAPIKYVSFIDPISAVLCLVNGLILGVTKQDPKAAAQYLGYFEQYVDKARIYHPSADSIGK